MRWVFVSLTATVILKPSVPTLLLCNLPHSEESISVQLLVVCCELSRHTLGEFSGSDIPSRKLLLRHRQPAEEEQNERQEPKVLHG